MTAFELVTKVHVQLPQLDVGLATTRVLGDCGIQNLEGLIWLALLPIDVHFSHCDLAIIFVILADLLGNLRSITLSNVNQVAAKTLSSNELSQLEEQEPSDNLELWIVCNDSNQRGLARIDHL